MLFTKTAVLQVIWSNTTPKNKLILKTSKKNISTIIAISDINHLTLVPPTVRKSQRTRQNERPYLRHYV